MNTRTVRMKYVYLFIFRCEYVLRACVHAYACNIMHPHSCVYVRETVIRSVL